MQSFLMVYHNALICLYRVASIRHSVVVSVFKRHRVKETDATLPDGLP